MQSLLRTTASALLFVSITASCRKQAEPVSNETVATVGSRVVTRDDFTRYLERNAGTTLAQLVPQAASALLDQDVNEILLAERASEVGMTVSSAAVADALRNDPGSTSVEKRDEMQRSRFLNDVAAKLPPVSEADIAAYYQSHPNEFKSAEQVHVRQILVHTQADADAAAKELKEGQTFEAVSAKYSKAPNASRGGDIGMVERGQLPKAFEDVIFALAPGGVSAIVNSDTEFFHLFKVDEKKPAGTMLLDAARPLIEQRLREERVREQVERITIDTARQKSVRIYPKQAGFAYNGRYPAETE